MNEERELLVRAKVLLECVDTAPLQDQADLIIKEIQELLAQPDNEQEPVAWVWNPARDIWEPVAVFGHWQEGAIYVFGATAPEVEQEPVAWLSLSDIQWMDIVNNSKILELTDGRHNSEEAVNLAVKMAEEKCKKNNS